MPEARLIELERRCGVEAFEPSPFGARLLGAHVWPQGESQQPVAHVVGDVHRPDRSTGSLSGVRWVKTDAVEHGLDADVIEARDQARSFVERPKKDVVHVRGVGVPAGDYGAPQSLGPLQLLKLPRGIAPRARSRSPRLVISSALSSWARRNATLISLGAYELPRSTQLYLSPREKRLPVRPLLQSPRACSRPAVMAACWPKSRLTWTSLTRTSAWASFTSVAHD